MSILNIDLGPPSDDLSLTDKKVIFVAKLLGRSEIPNPELLFKCYPWIKFALRYYEKFRKMKMRASIDYISGRIEDSHRPLLKDLIKLLYREPKELSYEEMRLLLSFESVVNGPLFSIREDKDAISEFTIRMLKRYRSDEISLEK